jgi:hypothetical protein
MFEGILKSSIEFVNIGYLNKRDPQGMRDHNKNGLEW